MSPADEFILLQIRASSVRLGKLGMALEGRHRRLAPLHIIPSSLPYNRVRPPVRHPLTKLTRMETETHMDVSSTHRRHAVTCNELMYEGAHTHRYGELHLNTHTRTQTLTWG